MKDPHKKSTEKPSDELVSVCEYKVESIKVIHPPGTMLQALSDKENYRVI
ncbi:MAG: hypothetical protein JWO00_326 [Candidatus Parcubacteria bacterium]|nr:hypothetical protein [Candidatus Parcubacteria bacterium]